MTTKLVAFLVRRSVIPSLAAAALAFSTLGPFGPPAKQFACGRCHRVRHVSPAEPSAWNHFVTYLSGGLLFGHEVEKPKGYTPRRQRKYRPQANRPAPRRELVRRRLIAGRSRQS